MGTRAQFKSGHQVFFGKPQFIATGNIAANASVVNSTDETELFASTISEDVIYRVNQQFRLTLAGTISSDGTDDVTLTLKAGSTDVLAFTTVSYPNEDDKAFMLDIVGRFITVGSSGKVVATGRLDMLATGMAAIVNGTANAGVSVDTTADISLNVTAEFDGASADSDVIVNTAILQMFN